MHPTSQPALSTVSRLASFTPGRLFTSQLNFRSATILTLLCAPPLLIFFAICVPSLIFDSPDQNTYFYFAHGLSQDLSSSVSLGLAAICPIFALVLPAPRTTSPTGSKR
jgi:hypothetical protein